MHGCHWQVAIIIELISLQDLALVVVLASAMALAVSMLVGAHFLQ